MNHDTFHIGLEDPEGQCIVCGKRVTHGNETARLNVEGSWVILCCPLCFGVYEKKPEVYLALRDLKHSQNAHNHPPAE